MSTSQIDRVCARCGVEYLAEFDTTMGTEEMITSCNCDKVEEQLRNEIKKLKKENEELNKKILNKYI